MPKTKSTKKHTKNGQCQSGSKLRSLQSILIYSLLEWSAGLNPREIAEIREAIDILEDEIERQAQTCAKNYQRNER